MKVLAGRMLRILARQVFRRYRPTVIGITGSYGKTSAKEAIAAVLGVQYHLRSSQKSFNNDFGVPFTILDIRPGPNWWQASLRAVKFTSKHLLIRVSYPTLLVLEMGADKPGDIERLTRLARPTIGVVTGIGPTHLQKLKTVEAVLEEKLILAKKVPPHGWVVLNGDDHRLRGMAEQFMSQVITYGFDGGLAVRCVDAAFSRDEKTQQPGMILKVRFNREEFPFFVPGVIGRQSLYAPLAAIAVGLTFHMDMLEIGMGLKHYQPPPGRMRLLSGIHDTTLIDDSYNASPDTVRAGIEALREFPAEGRRIAVLGDMLELGDAAQALHRNLGQLFIDEQIDILVIVGRLMAEAADEAIRLGFNPTHVWRYPTPEEAGEKLRTKIKSGDVIYLKGSQSSRIEKVTKSLMAEPHRARQLLVRQERKWLRS